LSSIIDHVLLSESKTWHRSQIVSLWLRYLLSIEKNITSIWKIFDIIKEREIGWEFVLWYDLERGKATSIWDGAKQFFCKKCSYIHIIWLLPPQNNIFFGEITPSPLIRLLETYQFYLVMCYNFLIFYLHVMFNDMLIYNDFSTFKTWNQDQLWVIFCPIAWFVHQSQMPKNPLKKFAPMIMCNNLFFFWGNGGF
jgi:hypothetical protein